MWYTLIFSALSSSPNQQTQQNATAEQILANTKPASNTPTYIALGVLAAVLLTITILAIKSVK